MLSFANMPGNLYNRLGKLGLLIKQSMANQATQLTNFTDTTNGVVAQYNAESDLQALIGSTYISTLNSLGAIIGGTCQNLAAQTVNRMIFRDNPQINQTLTSVNLLSSLQNIIQQMQQQGASILAMVIGATPSAITGVGNAVIVASTKRPLDGKVLENSFQENILLTCSQDSYTGGATAGSETVAVTGTGSASTFDFNWPLGSNASTSIQAINGNQNNSFGNLINNGGYESWTGNTPNNYTISTGTAGVNIFKETTIVYDGSASLRMTGDGTSLTTWYQPFNSSSGTTAILSPQTQYAFNVFVRRDGTAAGSGLLQIELVDSLGNVINDNNSVPNSFQINLTALTTNFAAYNGVFRTPTILPSTVWLRYRTVTGNALTNGRSVYFDKASFGQMTQVYTSGPFVSIHAGSNPLVTGDYGTVAVTNSRGAGGTLSTFQTLLARLFPIVYSNELLFPSSNVPTISDSALIA